MSSCINPSLVRQYLFCPMAAYYVLTGAAEPPTERMKRGKEIQREVAEAAARALGAERAEYSVRLEGRGICGVVDAVVWIGGRPAPLEVKYAPAPSRIPPGHKAQAAAYAMAAEATYGKAVGTAYIYYAETGTAKAVAVTKDLRDLVQHVAQRIGQMQRGWTPQPNQPPAKCQGCWYRKYCGLLDAHVERI
ncbi:MAG: CRISPR-associated protein Cas4 [Thermoproteus sp.]